MISNHDDDHIDVLSFSVFVFKAFIIRIRVTTVSSASLMTVAVCARFLTLVLDCSVR